MENKNPVVLKGPRSLEESGAVSQLASVKENGGWGGGRGDKSSSLFQGEEKEEGKDAGSWVGAGQRGLKTEGEKEVKGIEMRTLEEGTKRTEGSGSEM